MSHRDSIIKLIKVKTDLDDPIVKNIEVGIFNWCINFAEDHKISKYWSNPKFYKIYIEKSRSIISNLSGEYNMRLIKRLREKEFLPHELAFMKPENMCPEAWRDVKEDYLKKFESAFENKAIGTLTEMFKCMKCKKQQCTYFTLQTRRADESETVFVRCVNCGNSWRIN